MRHGGRRQIGLAAAIIFVLVAMLMPAAAFGQEGAATPVPVTGYYYVVSRGETWGSIARKMGMSVAEMQANNPQAVRPNAVLWVGDRLYVPNAPGSAPEAQATVVTPAGRAGGYWYAVKSGDTWAKVARATGVSMQALWQANPTLLDANRWLYRGQRVWIPVPGEVAAPAPTATATEAPTATATEAPTATATEAPTATATEAPTATATEVPAAEPTASATVAAAAPSVMEVAGLAGVAQALATAAAAAESAQSAVSLEAAANAVATAAAAAQSAVATITAAQAALAAAPAAAAVLTATPAATVVPTMTPVPTATRVASTATPASTATTAPVATKAPAAAVTAAPTAPMAAASEVCLLDRVLAANQVFDLWGQEGFQPAILAYQIVLSDTTSKACGEVDGELALLRDFARYRMLLAYIGLGQGNQATALRAQMETPMMRGAADAFLNSLKTSGSIVQACRDTTKFATANPAAWQWLVDLGVEFKPSDLCPLG